MDDIFVSPDDTKEVEIQGKKFVLRPWSAEDMIQFSGAFSSISSNAKAAKEEITKNLDFDKINDMLVKSIIKWESEQPITKESVSQLKPMIYLNLLTEILTYNIPQSGDVAFFGG